MPASCASNRHRSRYGSPVPNVESIPRLFGTDGVRGTAGRHPLDPPTVRRLGAALVRALAHRRESGVGNRESTRESSSGSNPESRIPNPAFLIGRDTRESGTWIEAELAHGAAGEGTAVQSAGIVPTPAIA